MKIKRNYKRFISLLLPSCLLMTGISPAFSAAVGGEKIKLTEYFTSSDWIWSSEEVVKNSTSYFRKEFSFSSALVKMQVKASAHNHLKYYINGNLITGYVSPAPASLPENVNFLSYELEGEELNRVLGGNKTHLCLAAAVQYMGNSATNYINGVPAFWTEVVVTLADGNTQTLKTDTSWHALDHTPYAATKTLFPKRNIGTQVDYDARKMPDGLAWTQYGYDEASYTADSWHDAVKAKEETKNWKLRQQNIPEGAVHKELTPTTIGKQEAGYQVFDAGQLVTGWVRIRASAPEGTKIYIRYSEYLDGDVVHHGVGSTRQTSEEYRDFYTFSGNGVETFAADFDYRAFRYFEIVGLPDWIQAEDITVEWASTDIQQISTFTSSDPFLTQLYEACINTQINNTIGITVDCPHREQAQYLADSQLQYALFSYAFEEAPEMMYKTLFDFATQQLKNGRFTYTAPTEAYKSMASIPEWDLRYTAILQRYYELTGDLEATAEFYEVATKNVSYHMGFMKNGLLPDEPGAWNISDHPGKAVPDDPGFPPTVANLLLYDSMNRLSQIASILGKTAEAAEWERNAKELKDTVNSQLMSHTSGSYYMHAGTSKTNPGVTAMAINVGIAPAYYLEQQLKNLERATPDTTSVVLTYELLRALMEHGNAAQKEAAYQRMVTSWGPMLEKGHKTTWERFEDSSSHSHAWSAYPAYFMLSGFAGIRWAEGSASVTPYLPKDVDQIQAKVKKQGTDTSVSVSLKRENGYKLTVTTANIPEAMVAVPRAEGGNSLILVGETEVFRSGKGSSASGVTYVKNDSEYVYFSITGGTEFQFSSIAEPAGEGSFSFTVEATEGGKVLRGSEAITLPYSSTVASGESIVLKAEPEAGYVFVGWSGSLGSSFNPLELTVTGNTAITAVFEKREGKITPAPKEDGQGQDLPQGSTPVESSGQSLSLSGGANIPLILSLILIPVLLIPCGIVLFKKRK